MAGRNLHPTTTDDDISIVAQLERLLAANQRLEAEFERHRASEALWRQERAMLFAMLDQVPDYLFAKDRDSRFTMANRATANDLGLERGQDIIGLTDFEVQPDPAVARKFVEDDREVMSTGQPKLDIEEYMHDANGGKQWLLTSKVPLRDDTGEVIGLVGVARNMTERKQAQDQVRFLAFHDVLTGLPNRLLFEQRLEGAHAGVSARQSTALLFLDLDRFKNVNDTLGHASGDELIRQVAQRLSKLVRATDTVARLGGDEFAVVMSDCRRPDDPEALSRRILRELSRPFELFGDAVFIDVSIGIAKSGDAPTDSKQMLRQADIALYRAKARGRGRYEVFVEGMAVAALQTRRIEQDLRQALATGIGLYSVYQPIFDTVDQRLVGVEALARWDHPALGTLSPQAFIGVAEDRGLIDALGENMLRRACAMAQKANLPWVAVNVSPVQFRNERFEQRVMEILTEADLPPHRLQLEITEGMLLEHSDSVQQALKNLRAKGVTIALDDFGTGYSSINYLRRYNVDKLKIDRSFVSQLGTSDAADAIVTAMVTLARAMQLQVTAEGVETRAQHDMLKGMGCDELQGFFLGEPVDEDGLGTHCAP